MNLFEDSLAPPTRFDLSFRLGDIPVRVHPYFWLTTAILGLNTRLSGIDIFIYLLIWTAIVFVLILDFRRPKHVLAALAPLGMGVLITLGIMGICGLSLNPANMIAFPLIWAGLFFYSWSMLKTARGR